MELVDWQWELVRDGLVGWQVGRMEGGYAHHANIEMERRQWDPTEIWL